MFKKKHNKSSLVVDTQNERKFKKRLKYFYYVQRGTHNRRKYKYMYI